LTASQRGEILREANALYDHARQAVDLDPAEVKQAFASAARKYQTLVDSGVDRGKLFFNLANAYLQAGQIGRAVANYERARVRLPGDRAIAANLQYARSLLPRDGKSPAPTSIWQAIATWNATISRAARWTIGATGWTLVWMALTGRLYTARFPVRSTAAAGLILLLLAGASIGCAWSQTDRGERAIVVTQTVLRQGNGPAFDAEYDAPLREGDALQVLDRRGEWLHVRTCHGRVGWIPAASVELMRPLRISSTGNPHDGIARCRHQGRASRMIRRTAIGAVGRYTPRVTRALESGSFFGRWRSPRVKPQIRKMCLTPSSACGTSPVL